MLQLRTVFCITVLCSILSPARAESESLSTGAGEQASYVTYIATTAPLRVCRIGEQAYRNPQHVEGCTGNFIFDRTGSPPLSPKDFLESECPGAVVESAEVLTWHVSTSSPKAVIKFTIPANGCPNKGSAL